MHIFLGEKRKKKKKILAMDQKFNPKKKKK
jgi:hypothetical protein